MSILCYLYTLVTLYSLYILLRIIDCRGWYISHFRGPDAATRVALASEQPPTPTSSHTYSRPATRYPAFTSDGQVNKIRLFSPVIHCLLHVLLRLLSCAEMSLASMILRTARPATRSVSSLGKRQVSTFNAAVAGLSDEQAEVRSYLSVRMKL